MWHSIPHISTRALSDLPVSSAYSAPLPFLTLTLSIAPASPLNSPCHPHLFTPLHLTFAHSPCPPPLPLHSAALGNCTPLLHTPLHSTYAHPCLSTQLLLPIALHYPLDSTALHSITTPHRSGKRAKLSSAPTPLHSITHCTPLPIAVLHYTPLHIALHALHCPLHSTHSITHCTPRTSLHSISTRRSGQRAKLSLELRSRSKTWTASAICRRPSILK